MREWWSGLSARHKVVIAVLAVLLSLFAAFWLTAEGVGDPDLCSESGASSEEECPATRD